MYITTTGMCCRTSAPPSLGPLVPWLVPAVSGSIHGSTTHNKPAIDPAPWHRPKTGAYLGRGTRDGDGRGLGVLGLGLDGGGFRGSRAVGGCKGGGVPGSRSLSTPPRVGKLGSVRLLCRGLRAPEQDDARTSMRRHDNTVRRPVTGPFASRAIFIAISIAVIQHPRCG